MTDNFICALSGIAAPEEILLDDENGEEVPMGWIRVTLERVIPNPKLVEIHQTKAAMLAAATQQIPEEVREAQQFIISTQLDAQFFALEQSTPEVLTLGEQVYIAPPEMNEQLLDEYNAFRETLSLDPMPNQEEETEEDGTTEEDEG